MALAAAPSDTNTTENPSTKKSDAITTRRRDSAIAAAPAPPVPCISSSVTPEMYERYPGISGRTHGDTNDNSPAKNAVKNVGVACSNMDPLTVVLRRVLDRRQRDDVELRKHR